MGRVMAAVTGELSPFDTGAALVTQVTAAETVARRATCPVGTRRRAAKDTVAARLAPASLGATMELAQP